LTALTEDELGLSPQAELEPREGFAPGTSIYSGSYPAPGGTSYPDDGAGLSLSPESETTETLTALAEDTRTITALAEDTKTLTALGED
jgi:hypothetical protein